MAASVAIRKLQDSTGIRHSPNGDLFPAGLVVSRDFADIDELAAAIKNWNHEGLQLAAGSFRGQLLLSHTAGMQIHRVRLSPAILVRGFAVPGSIAVGIQTGGTRRAYWRGETLRPTDVAVLDGGDEIDFHTTGPTEMLVVSVDRELFQHYVNSLRRQPLSPNLTDCRLTFSSLAESQWLTRRWTELAERTLYLAHRLADSNIARHLEAEILDALLAKTQPVSPEPSLAERRLMASRAHKYMVLNLDVPMTIKDICEAVGTAERTLHLGFRESFGITPKKFLKTMRLSAARRDLQHPRADTTVTEVALRWGFFHLARFAGDYRSMFAESPSVTLRRR